MSRDRWKKLEDFLARVATFVLVTHLGTGAWAEAIRVWLGHTSYDHFLYVLFNRADLTARYLYPLAGTLLLSLGAMFVIVAVSEEPGPARGRRRWTARDAFALILALLYLAGCVLWIGVLVDAGGQTFTDLHSAGCVSVVVLLILCAIVSRWSR